MRPIRLLSAFFFLFWFLMLGQTHAKSDQTRFHYKNKVAVLMYHHIAPQEYGATISAQRFRGQLEALQDSGYHFISMSDFVMFKLEGKPVPDNAVLITFDDGYESVYTDAYPILKDFQAPATTFVVVRSTDQPLQHGESTPHLSWPQMREMMSNGMSFYSHTFALHYKAQSDIKGHSQAALACRIYSPSTKKNEADQNYRNRIKSDLQLADRRLSEELGNKTKLLAFPYGIYNKEAMQIAKDSGTALFFTTKAGINGRDRNMLVNRINAGSPKISPRDLLNTLKYYDEKAR